MKRWIFAQALLASAAFGGNGGISDGGGKIAQWSSNPWFLENTRVVNYCLDMDVENMRISRQRALEVIKESLQDWQEVFGQLSSEPYEDLSNYKAVRVGTQSFQLVSCESNPQVRFQFGTLAEDQREVFADPQSYVAAAVRTAYDLQTLTSEGFVYVSPVSGDLAPEGRYPDLWSDGNNSALKIALWHELGHVFGVSHGASLLMEPWILEVMSEPEFHEGWDDGSGEFDMWETLKEILNPQSFIAGGDSSLEACDGAPKLNPTIFGEHKCARIIYVQGQMKFYGGESLDSLQLLASGDSYSISQWTRELTSVYLPKEQRVYYWRDNPKLRVGGETFMKASDKLIRMQLENGKNFEIRQGINIDRFFNTVSYEAAWDNGLIAPFLNVFPSDKGKEKLKQSLLKRQ